MRRSSDRHRLTNTTWALGTSSIRRLNDALASLFVEVVDVPRRPSEAAPVWDVAAVFEPRIVSAGLRYPRAGEHALPTHVIYAITVYAPDGARVAFWSAAEPVDNPLDAVVTVKRSFEGVMREAARRLTTGFGEVTEVRQWLTAQGVG